MRGFLGPLLVVLFFSCQSKVLTTDIPFQGECLEGLHFEKQEDFIDSDPDFFNEEIQKYDERILAIAYSIGGMEELEQLSTGGIDSLRYLFLKNKLQNRVFKMQMEIHALSSAIDCEEEKSEQLATFLSNKVRRTERNLTAAAIITGAVVSVGIGTMLLSNVGGDAHEYLGIAGGLVEVFLGLRILKLDKKVEISHRTNILKDIYRNDKRPDYFPASVWYYFNLPQIGSDSKSLKEMLVERWNTYILSEEETSIYLSSVGNYNATMLSNRAEMLDQLEAQLNLINQHLLHFLNELDNIDTQSKLY